MLKPFSLLPSLTLLAAAITIDVSSNVSDKLTRRQIACNGSLLCCDSVEPASSPTASALLTATGISVSPPATPIGITCVPLVVVGAGSGSCTSHPVCCDLLAFNGLFAINCIAI